MGLMVMTTPPAPAVADDADADRFLPVLGQLASGETSGLLRMLGRSGRSNGSGGANAITREAFDDPQQSCREGDRA